MVVLAHIGTECHTGRHTRLGFSKVASNSFLTVIFSNVEVAVGDTPDVSGVRSGAPAESAPRGNGWIELLGL